MLVFPIIGCVVVMGPRLRRPHFCQKLDGTREGVLSHIGSDEDGRYEVTQGSDSLQAALSLPFYKVAYSSCLKPSQGCFQCALQEKAPAQLESR